MLNIIHIVGARPNFIKAAPVIKKLNTFIDINNTIVHTGQHYDKNMSEQFFIDLEIPKPDINLGIGGGTHAIQTANIMIKCEEVFNQYKPDVVVVYGDVNSSVAAAVVASKIHLEESNYNLKVVHVESGLRSGDRTMPEELNRIVTDHLSDYLFVSCEDGLDNLKREGIPEEKCFMVGNTMIDSLIEFEEKFDDSDIIQKLELTKNNYFLITIHRPFTVDNKERLLEMMDSLVEVSNKTKFDCVFPMHPRTRKTLEKYGVLKKYLKLLRIVEPLGYIDFMSLQKNAKMIITDSGGIQEESTYFKVPCLTVRDNTERPVTIHNGTNKLIGTDYKNLVNEVQEHMDIESKTEIKYWDGKSSERIANTIRGLYR